jgi:chromosome segregation ATPase
MKQRDDQLDKLQAIRYRNQELDSRMNGLMSEIDKYNDEYKKYKEKIQEAEEEKRQKEQLKDDLLSKRQKLYEEKKEL